MKARMKDKFDPSKNYPTVDGVINIPADQAYALAEYIMQGKPIGERNGKSHSLLVAGRSNHQAAKITSA